MAERGDLRSLIAANRRSRLFAGGTTTPRLSQPGPSTRTVERPESRTLFARSRRPSRTLFLVALATLILAVGCSSHSAGRRLNVNPGLGDDRRAADLHAALEDGAVQVGQASWYGPKFHGRTTANGERFDMDRPSAAHKTLPFGTVVEVHNLDNGRKIQVRINDRGPFIRGRILDLSRAAAKEIGMIGRGVVDIELALVSWPRGRTSSSAGSPKATRPERETPTGGTTWIQAGAFRDAERARRQAVRLQDLWPKGRERFVVTSQGGWHRVRIRLRTRARAEELLDILRADGVDAVIMANP